MIYIKEWVINICTAVFFIVAVEMILPHNNMKKYAKFVLGLILITVIMNPIITIFDKNFNLNTYIDTACDYIENKSYKYDYDKCKINTIENTTQVFSKNLEQTCQKKLKEKFPKDTYEVNIQAGFDKEEEKFTVNLINIGFSDEEVKKIKKIKIGKEKQVCDTNSQDTKKSNLIKNYVSDILDISKEKIKIYKI